MRCPLKVRLLRDDFGRLVFLYAVKRWSRYWTGLRFVLILLTEIW